MVIKKLVIQSSIGLISTMNCATDSGGLELWFGDLAWSLGRKLNNVTPFHRHQLFKLSYKLLSLTPDKAFHSQH